MSASSCSAVIVRWRGGAEVGRCVRSLLAHGGPLLDRIVLVDSGSGDRGAERLAAELPQIEVVALPVNRSFAWAASQGVDRTTGAAILLLNPDTVVLPGAVDVLVSELARRPDAAGTVPILTGSDDEPQTSWQLRRLPSPLRLAVGLAGAPQFPAGPPGLPVAAEQPAAAAWLVRRSVWNSLGGLDPAFAPAWWEDVDFCARLRRSTTVTGGFWVAPQARIIHAGGSSLASLGDAAFLAAYYRNLLRYAERHHPERIGMIRTGLRLSLGLRAAARPARRAAYRAALGSLAPR